jgi:Reverse transcriptase (RNA-dependent DNA polymerase)
VIEKVYDKTNVHEENIVNTSNEINGVDCEDTQQNESIQIDKHDEKIEVEVQETNGSSKKVSRKTRSGRQVKMPKRFDDYVVYESLLKEDDTVAFTDNVNPINTLSSKDNFYYHEILREPDRDKFIEAMRIEIEMHNVNQNWIPVRRDQLPIGTTVLPSVWAMRRKRRFTDGKIYKWKARINVDGSKQVYGVNYWDTYAPVAAWISIRLVLCLSSINGWITKTFDFVQAFPQAPSEVELYIAVPKGCEVDGDSSDWAMKVLNNIYGQKQAGKFGIHI